MKGIIFSTLGALVEEKFGLAAWDKALEEAKSRGVFTAGGTYPDAELFAIVGALSGQSRIPVPDLVRVFGEYAFHALTKMYPQFTGCGSLKAFLKSVDGVIHVEVRKLYPGAGLPKFTYEDPAPDRLVMIYRSERKLCALAEGLIDGACAHFGENVTRQHTKCMHKGDDHCRIEITFGGKQR